MSRIGVILRGVLRWLSKRLPLRIGRLLIRREPEKPTPRTMAESRKQALAAWEQLVSEHAPHLLRESSRGRKGEGEMPLRWPRMEPFESSRRRTWPSYPAPDHATSLQQAQSQRERPEVEEWNRSGSWPADAQPPDNSRTTHSRPAANAEPERKQIRTAAAAWAPDPESAPRSELRRWREPVTTNSESVRSRHTEWTTESAGHRASPPGTSIPVSDFRPHNRMGAPSPEPAHSQPEYDAPLHEAPNSCGRATGTETDAPGTGPQHRAAPWPEIPGPEGSRTVFERGVAEPAPQHSREDPWPELPEGPLLCPSERPRPIWLEAGRRRRLLDEQRGVL